ncbi:OVARIAN TUMOR DOMAIN-containing deubiquitinating enzyme 12-like [Silene latifolia]|uniref:OVARIAN TUMOR DOMAIN-containing deubiquitinating enzyme 12-like n=1 Tax=Silene latifolia TaxID=37657 RepID=UPI003D77AE1A
MTTSEPDQDVIRWGLNLLDVGSYFTSSYGCDGSQDCNQDGRIYHDQYMTGYNFDTSCNSNCSYAKNEAVSAHDLQEEFSRFQVEDAVQTAHGDPHHFQQSDFSTDWLLPSSINYCDVHENAQGMDDAGNSSSCSSPGDRSNDGEDYSYSLEFVNESSVDGELGKRLNQMVPVPHVPRINGEIPSMDEATSDHQRLLDRLQLYELVERKVQGDGNCQFRALSDQFYRTPEHHKFVRQQVVNQLKAQPEFYEGYVPMEYGEYLKKMSKSGEWGDHVTLQAAADSYGVKIFLMTSFKDTCYMEIIPKAQKSKRIIFLSFWAEVHYNSIYPQGDLPPCETKRKKRWWRFGNN